MFLHHSVTIHPTPLPPPMIRTLSHLTTPFVSNAGDNNLLTTHLWCGVSSNSWKIQVGRICSGHEKSNSIKPHSIPAPHPTSPHLTSPRLTTLGHSYHNPAFTMAAGRAQWCRTPCRRQQCNHTVIGAPDHHKLYHYGCQGSSLT